jgi:hypothetical protein
VGWRHAHPRPRRGGRVAGFEDPQSEHHDMFKVLTAVGLLMNSRRPGGDQLGCLRADELLGQVPWRCAGHSDVDVHLFLAVLPSGTLRKPMAGPTPSGSMMEAPSGSSYPGSATYPSASAQSYGARPRRNRVSNVPSGLQSTAVRAHRQMSTGHRRLSTARRRRPKSARPERAERGMSVHPIK